MPVPAFIVAIVVTMLLLLACVIMAVVRMRFRREEHHLATQTGLPPLPISAQPTTSTAFSLDSVVRNRFRCWVADQYVAYSFSNGWQGVNDVWVGDEQRRHEEENQANERRMAFISGVCDMQATFEESSSESDGLEWADARESVEWALVSESVEWTSSGESVEWVPDNGSAESSSDGGSVKWPSVIESVCWAYDSESVGSSYDSSVDGSVQ